MGDELAVEVVDQAGAGWGQPRGPVVDLVSAALDAEGVCGAVVVVFVDERAITELNGRYRGLNEPTDVLSFRYADGCADWPERTGARSTGERGTPGNGILPDLGEMIVCPAVVHRYAVEEGGDLARQLGWTLVHGALHLAGYDHECDRGEMRRRERALLDELDDLVRALSPPAHRST